MDDLFARIAAQNQEQTLENTQHGFAAMGVQGNERQPQYAQQPHHAQQPQHAPQQYQQPPQQYPPQQFQQQPQYPSVKVGDNHGSIYPPTCIRPPATNGRHES